MPKEQVKDFMPNNAGESKASMLRDFKRDIKSIRHDQMIVEDI